MKRHDQVKISELSELDLEPRLPNSWSTALAEQGCKSRFVRFQDVLLTTVICQGREFFYFHCFVYTFINSNFYCCSQLSPRSKSQERRKVSLVSLLTASSLWFPQVAECLPRLTISRNQSWRYYKHIPPCRIQNWTTVVKFFFPWIRLEIHSRTHFTIRKRLIISHFLKGNWCNHLKHVLHTHMEKTDVEYDLSR